MRRRYTDEQFLEALADPTVLTTAEVCRRLGIVPRGGNYATLKALAARLGVELPRAPRVDPEADPSNRSLAETDAETLRRAVAASRGLKETLRTVGVAASSRSIAQLRTLIRKHSLDVSHFIGDRRPDGGLVSSPRRAIALEELLVRDRATNTVSLRRRLIREGLRDPICSWCARERWEGHPIPLELDHLNGDRFDNRLENLRLLCPNCHALTPTYRGRNISRTGKRA